MKNNLKKLLKCIIAMSVILMLSIFIESFGFNFKKFTLSKEEKGLIKIVDYKISNINNNKKSIPYSYIEEKGYQIEYSYNPILNYINTLDNVYFKGEIKNEKD